jgi:FdhD protein
MDEYNIRADFVYSGLSDLEEYQSSFRSTGATHACLCRPIGSSEYYFAEDISRHSAMSKAIGAALMYGGFPENCMLFTTGRLTGSLVHSCCYANLAAVASKAVATTEGMSRAQRANLTLIGSLTSSGFWLYNEGLTKII